MILDEWCLLGLDSGTLDSASHGLGAWPLRAPLIG